MNICLNQELWGDQDFLAAKWVQRQHQTVHYGHRLHNFMCVLNSIKNIITNVQVSASECDLSTSSTHQEGTNYKHSFFFRYFCEN